MSNTFWRRDGFKFDPSLPSFDELSYLKLVTTLEHRMEQGQYEGSIVTLHAENGTSLMGFVPHEAINSSVDLYVKNSFFTHIYNLPNTVWNVLCE